MSKKVAVFIGSLRRDSYNRKLFNEYQKLSKGKFEFEEIKISDLPHFNEDDEKAGTEKDKLDKISKIINSSDGVLFFTPEYNSSIPTVLKNALDWLSRVKPGPLENKKASILGASPGRFGTARAQIHLRQLGAMLNIDMMNKPEIYVSGVHKLFNEKGELTDEGTKDFLLSHIEAYTGFLLK